MSIGGSRSRARVESHSIIKYGWRAGFQIPMLLTPFSLISSRGSPYWYAIAGSI